MKLIEVLETIQVFQPDEQDSQRDLCGDITRSMNVPCAVNPGGYCYVCPFNRDASLAEELWLASPQYER